MNMQRGIGRLVAAVAMIYWGAALTIAGHAYLSVINQIAARSGAVGSDCWNGCGARGDVTLVSVAMADLGRVLFSSGTTIVFLFGIVFIAIFVFVQLVLWIGRVFQ